MLARVGMVALAAAVGALLLGGIAFVIGGQVWGVAGVGALFCGWAALPGAMYR